MCVCVCVYIYVIYIFNKYIYICVYICNIYIYLYNIYNNIVLKGIKFCNFRNVSKPQNREIKNPPNQIPAKL